MQINYPGMSVTRRRHIGWRRCRIELRWSVNQDENSRKPGGFEGSQWSWTRNFLVHWKSEENRKLDATFDLIVVWETSAEYSKSFLRRIVHVLKGQKINVCTLTGKLCGKSRSLASTRSCYTATHLRADDQSSREGALTFTKMSHWIGDGVS